MILEAFAGPGGISEALRMVLPDVPALGIELDADACATAEAAGHERLQADVSMLDLRPYVGRVVGFCAGPPCQSFSAAGRQLGKLDKPRIVAHIDRIRKAGRWLHYSREGWHDPRSPLVLEVLRYALTLRPEWVVLEQVPAVLPLWELVAEVLRDHGWHVETKVLQAEQYGVPQTRKRAILAARWCPWHEDGAHPDRLADLPCPIGTLLPAPTHRPYRKGIPREAGDQSLLPWVSMADALGWGMTLRPSHTVTAGGTGSGGGAEPIGNYSRSVMEREREAGRWALRQSAQANATVRALGEPAPTITAGHDRAERQWVRFGNQAHSAVRSTDEPAATVRFSVDRINAIDWLPEGQARNAGPGAQRDPRGLGDPSYTIRAQGLGSHPSGVEWVGERPAPTIVGTRRSSDGMLVGRQLADTTDRRDNGGRSGGPGLTSDHLAAVRVSVQEAAVLQSYRPDYPWRGSKSAQYRQVGDSAPPVLMAAVIRGLVDSGVKRSDTE